MHGIREITELFASLALNLKTSSPASGDEDSSIDLSISNLNRSLNLSEDSRVRVLDTALSLMCFTAPQVFDSLIEYYMKTIVTVLSSSVKCNVVRFNEEENLRIGGSISSHDVVEVVETCADVLGKMKGHCGSQELPGMLCSSLLYAVLKAAVSAPRFQHVTQLAPILDEKPVCGRSPALAKLLPHSPKDISLKTQEIPLRLMFWHLDPLILKDNVTKILQEYTKRPFLCLDTELYERIEWRSTLICLAFSPVMFTEARSLLHNWFLSTGLASLLELKIKFVSLLLDIVSRPTRWGISAEVSLTLPFSHAYFPSNHQFLRILAGPLTCGAFLQLVHIICKSLSPKGRDLSSLGATKSSMVDYKSMWAMAMNFPDWFYFSCVLLFFTKSVQDSFPSICIIGPAIAQHSEDAEPLCSAAAGYVAWILNPIDKCQQESLAQDLMKIARSFNSKQYGSDEHKKPVNLYNKKLKRPKIHRGEDVKEYDSQILRSWIKEFQDVYTKHIHSTVNSSVEAKTAPSVTLGHGLLLRRISLGILIGCSDNLNEEGWELLLHYAATGIILQSANTLDSGSIHRKWNTQLMEDSITRGENSDRKEAEKGACLVFYLTDLVENMSGTLFDSEESEADFICQVKSKAGKYLLKCVWRLNNSKVHEDDVFMLMDLRNRLIRWSHQGKDVFVGSKDIDDAVEAIGKRVSSL